MPLRIFALHDWAVVPRYANSVASGLLTDTLSINLRYEYEFDHGRPITAGRIDQRVFTTLGYTF